MTNCSIVLSGRFDQVRPFYCTTVRRCPSLCGYWHKAFTCGSQTDAVLLQAEEAHVQALEDRQKYLPASIRGTPVSPLRLEVLTDLSCLVPVPGYGWSHLLHAVARGALAVLPACRTSLFAAPTCLARPVPRLLTLPPPPVLPQAHPLEKLLSSYLTSPAGKTLTLKDILRPVLITTYDVRSRPGTGG